MLSLAFFHGLSHSELAAHLAAALDPLPINEAARQALLARLLLQIAQQQEGLPKEP